MTDCPACKSPLTQRPLTSSATYFECQQPGACGREYPPDYDKQPEYPIGGIFSVDCSCGRKAVSVVSGHSVCMWHANTTSAGPNAPKSRLFGGPAPTAAPAPAPQVSATQMVCWICQTPLAGSAMYHGKAVCSAKCGSLVVPQAPSPACPTCKGPLGGMSNYTHAGTQYCSMSCAAVHFPLVSTPQQVSALIAGTLNTSPTSLGGVYKAVRTGVWPDEVTPAAPPVLTRPTCYGCDRELSAYLDAPVLKTDDPDLCRSCRKETTREQ